MTQEQQAKSDRLDRAIEANKRMSDEALNLIRKRGREVAIFFRDKVEFTPQVK